MDLHEIEKKLLTGETLSDEELKLAQDNKDKLNQEAKSILEDENLDKKSLDELLERSLYEKVDAAAERLVKRFTEGVEKQRAKISDIPQVNKKTEDVTRQFLKALFDGDRERLRSLSTKAATYNEESDNSRGGYLVPSELMAEVLRVIPSGYGIARQEMRYLPFMGAGMERKIPTLSTSIGLTWVNEGGAKHGSNPTFNLVTQTLKKLAAIVPFTEELLEDTSINLTALIAQLFAEATGKEEDEQFFDGTGSPWTGILNNSSVNTVSLANGKRMKDITADNLLDMIDSCPSGAASGAKFYLHRHALSYIRKLKSSTTGDYIWGAPSNEMPGTIWGYPYVLCEAFPDKTAGDTAGKGIILFGNLKQAAIFGDKQQIRAKLLTEATVTDGDGTTVLNLAEQDMQALRLEERVGYLLALPTALSVLKTGT